MATRAEKMLQLLEAIGEVGTGTVNAGVRAYPPGWVGRREVNLGEEDHFYAVEKLITFRHCQSPQKGRPQAPAQ